MASLKVNRRSAVDPERNPMELREKKDRKVRIDEDLMKKIKSRQKLHDDALSDEGSEKQKRRADASGTKDKRAKDVASAKIETDRNNKNFSTSQVNAAENVTADVPDKKENQRRNFFNKPTNESPDKNASKQVKRGSENANKDHAKEQSKNDKMTSPNKILDNDKYASRNAKKSKESFINEEKDGIALKNGKKKQADTVPESKEIYIDEGEDSRGKESWNGDGKDDIMEVESSDLSVDEKANEQGKNAIKKRDTRYEIKIDYDKKRKGIVNKQFAKEHEEEKDGERGRNTGSLKKKGQETYQTVECNRLGVIAGENRRSMERIGGSPGKSRGYEYWKSIVRKWHVPTADERKMIELDILKMRFQKEPKRKFNFVQLSKLAQ